MIFCLNKEADVYSGFFFSNNYDLIPLDVSDNTTLLCRFPLMGLAVIENSFDIASKKARLDHTT